MVLLTGAWILFISGCGDGSSRRVLSRPVWECPQANISVYMDSSGFSYPEDRKIHLRWYIGPEENLEGYEIFRQSEGDIVDTLYATRYVTSEELQNPDEPIHWADPYPAENVLNYYVIYSFDSDGNKSARSDTVGYALLGKPSIQFPTGDAVIQTSRPVFQFSLAGAIGSKVNSFLIRVESDSADASQILWISGRQSLQAYDPWSVQELQYGKGIGGYTLRTELAPGRYRWRIDMQGTHSNPYLVPDYPCDCRFDPVRYPDSNPEDHEDDEFSFIGSKSGWAYFSVQ